MIRLAFLFRRWSWQWGIWRKRRALARMAARSKRLERS